MRPQEPTQPDPTSQTTTQRNVATVLALEAEGLKSRSRLERAGDAIAFQVGRPWFITAHLIWFGAWIGLNIPAFSPKLFDPYPYPLLTLVISLEAIFLTLFVLMSQNLSSRQADQRAHLNLQISLLSEMENTKMLQMLQAICAHHGLKVARDPEVEELSGNVEATDIIAEINKQTENLPPS